MVGEYDRAIAPGPRSYLIRCLAEHGAFTEGSTRGEESIQLAQGIAHPYTLSYAYLGVGALYLRQ